MRQRFPSVMSKWMTFRAWVWRSPDISSHARKPALQTPGLQASAQAMLQQQKDFFIGFHYSMKLHNFLRAAQLLGGALASCSKSTIGCFKIAFNAKCGWCRQAAAKTSPKRPAPSREATSSGPVSSAFRMVEEPHPTMTSLSISHTTRKQKSYLYPSFRRLLKANLWASTIVCRQRLFRLNSGSYIDMRASPPGSRSWSICRYKVFAYTARCKEHCQDNFKYKVYMPHSMHI